MEIHLYVHFDQHVPDPFQEKVLHQLGKIMTKLDDATAALNQANDVLTRVSQGVDNIGTDVTTLKQQVKDLQAASGGNTTPEFDAALQKVVDTANGLDQKVQQTDALFPEQPITA